MTSFEDQIDKYIIVWIWGNFPPFNLIIPIAFFFNLVYYFYDLGLNLTVNGREKAN